MKFTLHITISTKDKKLIKGLKELADEVRSGRMQRDIEANGIKQGGKPKVTATYEWEE